MIAPKTNRKSDNIPSTIARGIARASPPPSDRASDHATHERRLRIIAPCIAESETCGEQKARPTRSGATECGVRAHCHTYGESSCGEANGASCSRDESRRGRQDRKSVV